MYREIVMNVSFVVKLCRLKSSHSNLGYIHKKRSSINATPFSTTNQQPKNLKSVVFTLKP